MKGYQNILPYDGEVYYEKNLWFSSEASKLMEDMKNHLHWQHDELTMFGKKITTGRKVAWYGDEAFSYTYSKTTKKAIPWHHTLISIKEKTEKFISFDFNSCLCNLYHHGNEGMSWHSDDDKEFGYQPTIASLSFGAVRPFSFRHKESKEIITLLLEHGSILLMKGDTQNRWVHSLPKSLRIKEPRINLTFRKVL